jgi:hypothetical protein
MIGEAGLGELKLGIKALAFGFNLNSFAFAFNVDFFGAAAVPEEATEAEEEERDSVGEKTAWPGSVDTDEGN